MNDAERDVKEIKIDDVTFDMLCELSTKHSCNLGWMIRLCVQKEYAYDLSENWQSRGGYIEES